MNHNKDGFFSALEAYIQDIDEQFMKGSEGKKLTLKSFDYSPESDFSNGKINEIITNAEENFSNMLNHLSKAEFKHEVINYSQVTEIVFNKADKELFDILEIYLDKSWQKYKEGKQEIDANLEKRFLKVREHIVLSIKQKSQIFTSMSKKYKDFHKEFSEVQKDFGSLEEKLKKAQEGLESLKSNYEEKYNSLTSQFITILGIFSAIMMGAFGSIQGFSSVFENAKGIPIGKILIISSAGASGVTLILFLLLHSISKLTELELSSCGCSNRKRGVFDFTKVFSNIFGEASSNKCDCTMFQKYPSIFIINYFLYFIALSGFVFMYFEYRNYFNHNFWIQLGMLIIIYTFGSLLLIFIHKFIQWLEKTHIT